MDSLHRNVYGTPVHDFVLANTVEPRHDKVTSDAKMLQFYPIIIKSVHAGKNKYVIAYICKSNVSIVFPVSRQRASIDFYSPSMAWCADTWHVCNAKLKTYFSPLLRVKYSLTTSNCRIGLLAASKPIDDTGHNVHVCLECAVSNCFCLVFYIFSTMISISSCLVKKRLFLFNQYCLETRNLVSSSQ